MAWQIVNLTLIFFIIFVAILGIRYTWQWRKTLGAKSFLLSLVGIVIAMPFYGLQFISFDVATIVTLAKFQYLGLYILPVAWLSLVMTFNGLEHWLTPRFCTLIGAIPFITIVLAWTNEWHTLIWDSVTYDTSQIPPVFIADYGEWFIVSASYSIAVFAIVFLLLARFWWTQRNVYRAQGIMLIAGTLIPFIGNYSQVLDVNFGIFHPVPITFGVGMLCLWLAVFRLQFLEVMPLAYDRILNSVPSGVVVVDTAHRVLTMNARMRGILGLENDRVTGKTLEELSPEYARQWLNTKPNRLDMPYFEYKGTYWDIESNPIMSNKNVKRGSVIMWHDVTWQYRARQQERTEQAYRDSLLKIANTVHSTLDLERVMTLALDIVSKVVTYDAANILLLDSPTLGRIRASKGYDDEQNQFLADYVFPLNDYDTFQQVIDTQQPLYIADTKGHSSWGIVDKTFQIRSYVCAPILVDGRIVGFINLDSRTPHRFDEQAMRRLEVFASQVASAIENARLHDEANRQMEDMDALITQLRKLEELKSEMILIAAHDLKQPLSGINGYAEMLGGLGIAQDATVKHYVSQIQAQIHKMSTMINDVLSLKHIEEIGRGNLYTLDLCHIVNESYEEWIEQAKERQITYTLTPSDMPAFVLGDPTQLYEAVKNLIGNALKYTPKSGDVNVILQVDKHSVTFKVVDTGYGVPLEQQARIFTPFFRATNSHPKEIEGTGLGLHLVKNIIIRHRGGVLFESEAGKGSTFGFMLNRMLGNVP